MTAASGNPGSLEPFGENLGEAQSWHIQEINQCECVHVCVHLGAHG